MAATMGAGLPWEGPADRLADQNARLGEGTIIPTVCEMCFWKCGVHARVQDGKLIALTGNPDHPLSRGRLCPRGIGGIGSLYDPDRLSEPLIRVGERGSEEFRVATWEEALDRTAEGLRKVVDQHGPEALALLYHGAGGSFFKTLMKGMGCANIAAPSYAQCRGPRDVGFELTFGEGAGSPEIVDMPNTRVMALIGTHLGENMHNTSVQDFSEAIGKGMRVITVDPRFSVAAGKSAYWLPIRPGTDIALLLGWANVIIREGWYDAAYIERNAVGFDKFRAEVAKYTPEAVYMETGIKPEQIVATARELADAAPHAVVHPGRRVTWYGDDTQRCRAVALVNGLLGNWGRPGGFYMSSHAPLEEADNQPKLPDHGEAGDRPEGAYPFAGSTLANGLREATLTGDPHEIKAWMVYGTNLPSVLPDPRKTLAAIQKLDFMVAIDILPMEITGWADVVLPECTYLERHDDLIAPWYREPYVALRRPVVEPLGNSKPGWWMAKQLADRLGVGEHFPWLDPMERIENRLRASGYSSAQLQEIRDKGVIRTEADPLYLPPGEPLDLMTPSGKIEFWSQQLADTGFDPIPVYRRPEMPGAGEFRLLTGRSPVHTFGRTSNNARLLAQYPENEVWLNRTTAADMGLKSGDRVMMKNQDGATTGPVKVKATERIRQDCVYMVHGFGHQSRKLSRAYRNGGDDNALTTRYEVDPIMGGTGYSVNFVTLEKVEV
jgi:thiosulfate reductase/polysulfide reductase chain A